MERNISCKEKCKYLLMETKPISEISTTYIVKDKKWAFLNRLETKGTMGQADALLDADGKIKIVIQNRQKCSADISVLFGRRRRMYVSIPSDDVNGRVCHL